MRRGRTRASRRIPPVSVSLPIATVQLGATRAQMIWRGLDTGQDGWILAAGVLCFGVIGVAVGIVLDLPDEPR